MNNRIFAALAALSVCAAMLSGCTDTTNESGTASSGTTTSATTESSTGETGTSSVSTVDATALSNVSLSDEEQDASWDDASAVHITLDGATAMTDSDSGVTINGGIVTISAAGTYVVSGTLDDGQLIINTEEKVHLVLNGVSITSSTSSPLLIQEAKKVILTLAEGTKNTLTDSESYSVFIDAENTEPNAALYSMGDLFINGAGALTVNANYANGIQSKDTLTIISGTIDVTAVGNGIKGKDYLAVLGGEITVDAGGDGLKSDNTEDTSLGYIVINDGKLDITAAEDGIQAQTCLAINGGELSILAAGGSSTAAAHAEDMGGFGGDWDSSTTESTDAISTKGIKADSEIWVNGGTITIDAQDDAVHSNNALYITGGTLTASSGDDGMHADSVLTISGGAVTIAKSYEGMEAAVITISGGETSVTASDDGLNASDGTSSGGMGMMRGSDSCSLTISDGYLYVNADGDGLDSNGMFYMTGGTAIVSGPTNSGNGALDSGSGIEVSGGLLIAAGSVGMAEAPDSTSGQYAATITIDSQAAGTIFNITDSAGNVIVTFAPEKTYSNVVISSPDFVEGETYTVSVGGSCDGQETNGLYDGGTYSGGEEVATFTISDILTTVGSSGNTMGGGFSGGGSFDGGFGGGGMQGGMPGGGR